MPAFTTIFAGISALSGLKGVSDAKSARNKQDAANRKQATVAKEAAALGAQAQEQAGADVSLGTSYADDKLLKADATKKVSKKGTKIGGLMGSPTNIGGL